MTFRWKIFLAYMCVLGSFLSVYYVWTGRWIRTTYVEGVRQQLLREAELVESLLRTGSPEIDQQVDDLVSEGHRLTVIDEDGTVIGDSEFSSSALEGLDNHGRRPEVLEAKAKGVGSRLRFSQSVGEELLYVAVRATAEGPYIRVSTRVAGLQKATSDLRWTLAKRTVFLIGLGFPITFLLARYLSRTLDHLETAANKIAGGDFDVSIRAGGKDDVSRLGRAMQTMAHQLRDQVHTIESDRGHLQAVLDSMLEGVMVTDAESRITGSNPALLKIFGLREDPVGESLLAVLRNIEIQQQISNVRELTMGAERELQVGNLILFARSAPVRKGFEVAEVVTVFTDVTELRRLERARRDFIGNVSHELRTPLTSIAGYTEALIEGKGLDDMQAGFLRKIERNSAQLQEIVDALLELARIEQGDVGPNSEEIDFPRLFSEIRGDLSAGLVGKPVKLEFSERIPSATIRAPEVYLKRVLLNLLDNSLKYTEEGLVRVTVDLQSEEVLIAVSDSGTGIPEQDLDRVFERFYRGAQAVSERVAGSGMGLAITKHMVEVMGGRIWMESQLKKGTTVFFTIPKRGSNHNE